MAEKRKQANFEEKGKGFDYNWEAIYREGNLKKLNIPVLDMYIAKRNLKHAYANRALKQQKVDLITIDIRLGHSLLITTLLMTKMMLKMMLMMMLVTMLVV